MLIFFQGSEGDAVHAEIESVLRKHTNKEWEERLRNVDTCVEPVSLPENRSQSDAQLQSRDLDIDLQVGGSPIRLVKTPLKMTGLQFATTPGPRIGEHNKTLLGQVHSKL